MRILEVDLDLVTNDEDYPVNLQIHVVGSSTLGLADQSEIEKHCNKIAQIVMDHLSSSTVNSTTTLHNLEV